MNHLCILFGWPNGHFSRAFFYYRKSRYHISRPDFTHNVTALFVAVASYSNDHSVNISNLVFNFPRNFSEISQTENLRLGSVSHSPVFTSSCNTKNPFYLTVTHMCVTSNLKPTPIESKFSKDSILLP